MNDFEWFAELLERICMNSWRSAIGAGESFPIESVSSVLFTKEKLPSEWKFSFAVRSLGRWVQATRSIEPLEYDPYDPPPIDEFDPKRSMSPQNQASALAIDMLEEVRGRL